MGCTCSASQDCTCCSSCNLSSGDSYLKVSLGLGNLQEGPRGSGDLVWGEREVFEARYEAAAEVFEGPLVEQEVVFEGPDAL